VKEFYSNEQVFLTGGIVPSVYSLCIDCNRKIVHVLDLDRVGTRPVCVSFSNSFAENIFEQISLSTLGSYLEYQYLIYTTEGIVTKWKNNELVALTNIDECKPEFISLMKERRNTWSKYKALYNRK
jgi:hypothetical protein